MRRSGHLAATDDFARLGEVDAIILCVPTPLTRQREPDLSFIVSTTEAVAPHLRRGQLVVLESTTYPGTTREVMQPILERSGLRSGRDFFLAYSPEREDPGNADFATSDIPKVVGGDGPDALRLACALYDAVVARTVPVSSLEAAEAVKLTENIFRSVNIALVNELKIVFEAMGIDVWEVIEAAKTKPFGYMPFYPGPGLGGHCIPIDPFYLTWKAREFDIATRFIELAGEINTAMPQRVVEKTAEALERARRPGAQGRADPDHRRRLQEERRRHAREPGADDHGAAGTARRAACRFTIRIWPRSRRPASMRNSPAAARPPLTRRPPPRSMPRSSAPTTTRSTTGCLVEHCPLVIDTRNACARRGLGGGRVVKA